MKLTAISCLWLLCFCAISSAQPAVGGLNVGDPAPPLVSGKWVQGEPVTSFEPGRVYVVEFWATWCGPCVAAIPHLSELQDKYAEKGVVVIGQNVWEEDEALVEPFIKKMGDRMRYRVALDDKSGGGKGSMATTWMMAAGQNGIPASFVINQEGRIAWIGHPMGIDTVLEEVVAGTWDIAEHAEKDRKDREFSRQLDAAMKAKDWDTALRLARERNIPPLMLNINLEKGDYSQAISVARGMIAKESADPQQRTSAMYLATRFADHAAKNPQAEAFFREMVNLAKSNGDFAAAGDDGKALFMILIGDSSEALSHAKKYLQAQRNESDQNRAVGFALTFFRDASAKSPQSAIEFARVGFEEKLLPNADVYNSFAWDIATEDAFKQRDLDLALKLAEQSVELSGWKDANNIDTLARVQFERGDKAKAIETQRKAIELAPANRKGEFQKALDRYSSDVAKD